MTLSDQATYSFERLLGNDLPSKIGLAVSGGGDSIALLHLVADWAKGKPLEISVVTVDHDLRTESADEAVQVKAIAQRHGFTHHTAKWTGWTGQGNLQDAARLARRQLIEDWAIAEGIDTVLTGHTLDDQAETVLMRLTRGSGVDGLAGMAEVEPHGVRWMRPLLGMTRSALRTYLTNTGIGWIDDPSNDDLGFDRIKARQLLAQMAEPDLLRQRLSDTAGHMRAAQNVLDHAMVTLAQVAVTQEHGDLLIARKLFSSAADETRTRLLARALMWVSNAHYRPRFSPLVVLAKAGSGTLHGCQVTKSDQFLRITREYQAVKDTNCPTSNLWDGRWQLTGPHSADLRIAALGAAGDKACPARGESGLPHISRIASPAVFQNNTLISAPLAGFANGWRAQLAQNAANFIKSLNSH